jgi:tetratricopeptide (TPR) repeat protein
MTKTSIAAGILFILSMIALADLPGDFQAAVELYNKKDYPKAQEAFMKASETAPTPKSKSECLAYAASSLSRQKQYDQAMELAFKIPVKPMAANCRMGIMLDNGKNKELIEAFKDEDVGAWQDYIIHHGYYNRGTAYRLAGKSEAALKDLEKAVETSNTTGFFQTRVLSDLASVYASLKQDDKALEAYRRILAAPEYKGLYTYFGAAFNASTMLIKQGKYDEALAEIKKLDPLPASGTYKIQALEIQGDIYAAQSKHDDAKSRYNDALKTEGISKGDAERINNKISALAGK